MHVRTSMTTPRAGSEDFSVVRVRRRVHGSSPYVGGIHDDATRVETTTTASRPRGWTCDWRRRASAASQNLEASAYYLASTRPRRRHGAAPYGFSAATPNDPRSLFFSPAMSTQRFDPGIGFVTRDGYRRYQPGGEFNPRPAGSSLHPSVPFSASGRRADRSRQRVARATASRLKPSTCSFIHGAVWSPCTLNSRTRGARRTPFQ